MNERKKHMADNLKGIPFSTDDEGVTYPEIAKTLVYEQVSLPRRNVPDDLPAFSRDDVYVVWFAYVLGYWKALCSTSLPDGRYYEVTFHKERGVAFVDTYVKVDNDEVMIG